MTGIGAGTTRGMQVYVTNAADISGGGGGGAATIADGADVTQGAKADAKSTATDTTAVSLMSVTKQISASAQLSATAAKQPALGTALTPSTDVITTQRPSVTQVVSTALEAGHILKGSAGQLVELSVFSQTAQFILIMNSITVSGNGAVTLLYPPIPIAANQLIVLDLPAPIVASTGISVGNSTTGTFTRTAGGSDCVFYAQVN